MLPPTPPSISAGGGGPSGSSSDASVGIQSSNPFNFDFSGWVVNNKSNGTTSTGGNRDANQIAQGGNPGAGGLANMLGFDPKYLLLVGAVLLLMRRR